MELERLSVDSRGYAMYKIGIYAFVVNYTENYNAVVKSVYSSLCWIECNTGKIALSVVKDWAVWRYNNKLWI